MGEEKFEGCALWSGGGDSGKHCCQDHQHCRCSSTPMECRRWIAMYLRHRRHFTLPPQRTKNPSLRYQRKES
ncbi:MAG: hypothetical protein H6Q31_3269 [Bacteroidetes bacterium]|nr:hypothetical protein [Bacteroidota bacterium]